MGLNFFCLLSQVFHQSFRVLAAFTTTIILFAVYFKIYPNYSLLDNTHQTSSKYVSLLNTFNQDDAIVNSHNNGYKNCTKKETHIYYLKTHKTGSTTFAGILRTIVLTTNATYVAFYKVTDSGYIQETTLGKAMIVPHPLDLDEYGHVKADGPLRKLDINLEHTVFKESDVFAVMNADTKLVATVRHPFNHLKSSFNHYHLDEKFGLKLNGYTDPVEMFLKNVTQYQTAKKFDAINNRMIREFGYNASYLNDTEYVKKYIRFIVDRFDKVVITEYLNEGLVLLKNVGVLKIYYTMHRGTNLMSIKRNNQMIMGIFI
jgi:hypothetical protein